MEKFKHQKEPHMSIMVITQMQLSFVMRHPYICFEMAKILNKMKEPKCRAGSKTATLPYCQWGCKMAPHPGRVSLLSRDTGTDHLSKASSPCIFIREKRTTSGHLDSHSQMLIYSFTPKGTEQDGSKEKAIQ